MNRIITLEDQGPFQAWLWCGITVLNHEHLAVGDTLHIQRPECPATTLKYKAVAITEQPQT